MKSYFLLGVESLSAARRALELELSGQSDPWVLLSPSGDPIAHFHINDDFDGTRIAHIQADISGRHYSEDDIVVSVLKRLQLSVGGVIEDDQ